MKIDLSCPEPSCGISECPPQTTLWSACMFNLSDKAVVSIQAAFLSFDEVRANPAPGGVRRARRGGPQRL